MVHVKKVEIFGFKSFGFKNTTVQFEPGLVSISGPNGSGKSNILDAIIFAMGENKPKVMRVDKLRSLIHDIEGARRGPKMARSSVHFDNTDRKIPVDSDVVEITRELSEDGENTYYLNKKKTQRSHILDLLDMANAGLGQLNAVQQGTVTRISEFTSEEKRKTIEDLIGLSYFFVQPFFYSLVEFFNCFNIAKGFSRFCSFIGVVSLYDAHSCSCMGIIGTDINTSSVINSMVENSSSAFRIVSKLESNSSPCCSFCKKAS